LTDAGAGSSDPSESDEPFRIVDYSNLKP